MKWQGTWIGPGVLAGVLALGGCGRPFETGGGGAGGTGSTGGSGSTGGAGSGTTTTTGTTTTACTPGLLDTCGEGKYCDPSLECVSCLSATSFVFGPAQPITLGQGQVSGTFPRMNPTKQDLFYVDTNGQIQQAAKSATQGTWGTPSMLPQPYNPGAPTKQEGPLPWSDGMSVRGIDDASKVQAGSPILLFGSQPMGGSQLLYVANLPTSSAADALKMPPFVSGDRSIAVSFLAATPRAFWLRGGHLWSATSGFGPAPVPLQVIIPYEGGCAADPNGAMNDPWMGLDGGRLLFSSPAYTGVACTLVTANSQARLFFVDFDAGTGTAKGTAAQIFFGDMMDDDQTPSLSPDQCLLLFTRGTTLMTALRK